jgi:hypothetical protein
MTGLNPWLEQQTAAAPAALRACVQQHVRATPDAGSPPQLLAAAGERALGRALSRQGGREVALDLLAADGLITLALLHQAEHEPSGLAELARRLATQHGAV